MKKQIPIQSDKKRLTKIALRALFNFLRFVNYVQKYISPYLLLTPLKGTFGRNWQLLKSLFGNLTQRLISVARDLGGIRKKNILMQSVLRRNPINLSYVSGICIIVIMLFSSILSVHSQEVTISDSTISNLVQQKNAIDSSSTINDLKSTMQVPEITRIISPMKIFWAIIFFVIGYFVIKFITQSIEIWSEKSAERRIRGKAIVPIVKILSWIIVVYIVVQGIFRPPVQSLIAFGASIGVAVGFAAQDILKNIFGGFVILLDRPFKVGDKIEVGSVYGEVLDMSLRSTRIQTADDSLVTLPNGELMNQSISNSNSGEMNCQVVAEIYLPITIDTEKVRKIAIESAKVSKFIYLAKPIAVLFFNELKHDKLCYKMRLKAYVMDIRYEFAFKSEMTEIVMRELLKAKILNWENSI